MTPDEAFRALAESQLGLVHRDQLTVLGLTRRQVQQRVKSGVLEYVSPVVVRVVGSAVTSRQRALAAALDAGPDAALSHHSAAAIWGLAGFSLERLHVTRAHEGERRKSNLAAIHEPVLLLPEHVVRRGPFPLTTPSRTLFDLAGWIHVDRLARTVDNALAMRLTNARALHVTFDLMARRGRRGTVNMRAVLAERPPSYRAPESGLERRVQELLRSAGFPSFERQVDVGDDEGWIARVDFLARPERFILFVDGDRWHSMLTDRVADEQQQQRLQRAGYTVERVTERMVFFEPRELVARVKRHLRAIRAAS